MKHIERLWLIGCGNMAGAVLRRWIDSGTVDPANVLVVNRQDRDLPAGVTQVRELPLGDLPDAVMLGMKPFQIDEVAAQHGSRFAGVSLLISLLAGVEEDTLAAKFDAGAIVRAMPNLPVALGKGVVALNSASLSDRSGIDTLMAPLGLVEWVAIEHFNLVTALSGSGPGFTYRFIDALAAGATALGLPADQAQRMAVATVEGASLLAAASPDAPATLADRVASPRGSTREGLNVLDADNALVRLLTETLAATERRNAEMAAEAKG